MTNIQSPLFIALLLFNLAFPLVSVAQPVELPVGETRVFSLTFSPDGRRLAVGTGGQSPTVKVFEVSTRKELLNLPCERRGAGFSLAFHPDGKRLAIADYDLSVTIRNLSDGSELTSLPGDPERKTYRQARGLVYSPDGQSLIVGYSTGDVFVWDVEKKQVKTKFHHGNEITAVAVAPDGKAVATGTGWGLRVWNFADGETIAAFDQKSSGLHEVQAIRFLPDGSTVATVDSPGWIRTFSIEAGKESSAFKMPSVGAESTIHGLELLRDGKTFLVPGLLNGLDAKRPQLLQSGLVLIDTKTLRPHSFLATLEARVMAATRDGKNAAIATGETGDPVLLYDLTQGKPLK